jgi:ribonuclease J
VIDAVEKHGRKVAVVGRSMMNNVSMARKMGYLQVSPGTLVPLNEARQLPLEETVIVATGSQGEPTSALVRIANGEHQDIEIVPGDTVIISASPIPGNESLVSKTIDNLFRQGASVLYSRVAMVHVHGHASREELKMMLSLVKPRFFVPVHGEYRHLVTHAALAQSMGVPPSNTFVLEDGDVLEIDGEGGRVVDSVDSSRVLVDGRSIWVGESRVSSTSAGGSLGKA